MTPGFVSRQHPDRTALVTEDGAVLSYADLCQAIDRWAEDLPSRQLIFIVGDNDLPTVVCYLACVARGMVPLLLGKSIHEDPLNQLIRVYDPSFVFIPSESAWPKAGCVEVGREGAYALYRRPAAAPHALHDDLALLLATSGSTGSPRLVRLTAENLRANAASIAQYLDITPEDRGVTSLPFNYSYGLSVINSHLHAGASLVLSTRSLMEAAFWQQIRTHRVTSFAGVPYSYDILLRLRLACTDVPSLRTLTQAGGRMDPDKLRRVNEMCRAQGVRFFPMYGQTEATARIAYLPPEEVDRKPGSIGRAIPGGRLWIEGEGGQVIAAAGEVGELIYAGPNVSMGYADSADDLKLGDVNRGVLRTGDLARVDDDGCVFIEGRRRRFLKIFGIRISLDAVERIAADKGFVCAANGVDDRLVIHVVETPQLVSQTFRTAMAASLGLHPSAIAVSPLRDLPRLPTGKVDYQCLSQPS